MASVDEFFVDLFADTTWDQVPSLDIAPDTGIGTSLDDYVSSYEAPAFDFTTFDSSDPFDLGVQDPADPYGIGESLSAMESFGDSDFNFLEFDPSNPFDLSVQDLKNDPYGIGESLSAMGLLGDPAEEPVPQPGGITGLINSLIKRTGKGVGSLLNDNLLAQLAIAEYFRKRDNKKTYAPVGGEAYGDTGNLTDYRVNNLIPALMPGVAYGNVGGASQETDLTSAGIGMRQGGIASLSDKEGPGDVTLARLEPGEFVMTRKATQNIGVKNLYDMMRKAERMR